MSTQENMVLHTKSLCIGYRNKHLLQNLNLSLYKGEVICLIGKNGCGKSTLIRTICGLQPSISGAIYVNNKNIQEVSSSKKAKLISVVLTDNINAHSLTVSQIVSLGRHPYTNWFGNLTENDKTIIEQSIHLVHLENKSGDLYHQLSDGEKQRVMIAKALAQDTPIIILDEPSAHLDLPNRMEIMSLLQQLSKNTQKTILLSTHELDLALQTADKIWLMNDEEIIVGIPEDLVLNNKIEENFCSKLYTFNRKNGNFGIHYTTNKSIQLVGSDYRLYWTERALKRIGYANKKKSEISLTIDENTWEIKQQDSSTLFYKIEDLLEFLKSIN